MLVVHCVAFFYLLLFVINKPKPKFCSCIYVKQRTVSQVYCSEFGAFQLAVGEIV